MLAVKLLQEMALKNAILISNSNTLIKFQDTKKLYQVLTLNMKYTIGITSKYNKTPITNYFLGLGCCVAQ
jgi:hypothetical protein